MWFQILLFVVGLLMLIKGGDWFVDSASDIARRFHLPELLIGATVVAIGTTLPEVMVSAQGALAGSGGMAYGNSVGSIICNTALVAAVTVALKPGTVDRKALILPVSFFLASASFYALVAYFFGEFTRWVGLVLLLVFVVYMACSLLFIKRKDNEETAVGLSQAESDDSKRFFFSVTALLIEALITAVGGGFMIWKGGIVRYIGVAMLVLFYLYTVLLLLRLRAKKEITTLRSLLFLVIGAAVIAGGANLLVDSGTYIATELGVPDTVIALTFIALGTSLPELVTAITALAKGHGALSLGNVIGANLFNLILVSGIAILISPFSVPAESSIGTYPASLVLDIPVMLGVMLLLTIPALLYKKLFRWQGLALLFMYTAFCTLQFMI